MKINIGTRFFLFIAGIAALSIIIMIMAQRVTFDKGVRQLGRAALNERLELLSERLALSYQQEGGWEFIQGVKEIPSHFMLRRGGVADSKDNLSNERAQSGLLLKPVLKIRISDANKNWLAGDKKSRKRAIEKPIVSHQKIVGYLTVALPKPILNRKELTLAKRQFEALVWVGLIVLIVAGFSAWYLSKNLVKPIKKLKKGTLQMESGDFDVYFDLKRDDELGELSQNFNDLATALRKSKRDRQQWVADISHELRTPIATLRAELETLQDGYRPLNSEAINSLSDEVERLGLLVDDLYQLTQADSGNLLLNYESVDVTQLAEDSVSLYAERFAKCALKVELLANETILIDADVIRLKQLFSNLFENSLKYTDPDGSIIIAINQDLDFIEIEIEDSSPGVPDVSLPLLFERLYRLDSSRSRVNGSSGLGLAICKGIVSAHKGTIIAEGSSIGGVKVKIKLPKRNKK